MNKAERKHFDWIRNLDCSLCGAGAPSYAHHILDQGNRIGHFITIPLCYDCHKGPQGRHGDKTLFKIYKKTELQLLNETWGKK